MAWPFLLPETVNSEIGWSFPFDSPSTGATRKNYSLMRCPHSVWNYPAALQNDRDSLTNCYTAKENPYHSMWNYLFSNENHRNSLWNYFAANENLYDSKENGLSALRN